jgi:signal transduction histidine kinase
MEFEGKSYEQLVGEIKDLRKRLAELDEITRMLRASEDAFRLDEARLEALVKLAQMADATEQQIADFALEEAVRLTGSEVGWMGALDESSRLVTLYNFSSRAMRECEVVGRPHSFLLEGAGVWAEPIFTRRATVLNDYKAPHPLKKGFPEGHVELRNLLAIPLIDDGRVVAVAEVGNKKTDYDRSDVRQLSLLMNGVWRVILRKRAEAELREAKAQAELYIDLMGHDINNMNQVALGFLELALQEIDKGKPLGADKRSLLETPLETLLNSSRLIGNVKKLQSARAGGLKTRKMDLGRVLEEVRNEHSKAPGREVAIGVAPAAGYLVTANELLRDVFSNLVGNAIKHSPPDRPLAVDIKVLKVAEQGKDYYVVMVEDNGPGISPWKKAELFSRLDREGRKYLVSGLGLSLARTLVEDFGGRTWVEDRVPGDYTQGARFVVLLPAAQ